MTLTVAVFGLGEAGSLIAADMAGAGAAVRGYDPAAIATPSGVERHDDPETAVRGAALVMAITAAVDAQTAIAQAWNEIGRGTVYADLSTAPPTLKQDLNDTATLRGLPFADVALMAPVVGHGLATPSLASGPGAEAYATMVSRLGAGVEVIAGEAGEAATRKLLRSVFIKGMTAVTMEAMQAGEAAGRGDWLWDHLAATLTGADEAMLERLITSTKIHSERRQVEMESARSMLELLDVDPVMTTATVESLRRAGEERTFPIGGIADRT